MTVVGGGESPASSGYRPTIPLNVLQCIRDPHNKELSGFVNGAALEKPFLSGLYHTEVTSHISELIEDRFRGTRIYLSTFSASCTDNTFQEDITHKQ